MKRVALVAGILILSACGYDGGYRYSCQDPENWEAPECNPPLCKVDGNCTEALLGFDPFSEETTTTIATEETVAP
jgi:hypothetical protein